MNILVPTIQALNRALSLPNCYFAENGLHDFDEIPQIYGYHTLK
jgi:hypothetical protein